jgi:hypothetical protein
MPLLSERRDWPEIRAEELAARQANDQARALAALPVVPVRPWA